MRHAEKALDRRAARVMAAALTSSLLLPFLSIRASAADSPRSVVLYVDDDAPAGGDGTSWEGALQYLQDALVAASPGVEIRVAQGTYTPDRGANQTPGDVNASFILLEGLALRGSYAGVTAPDPDLRDFKLFSTVLTADLLNNDSPHWAIPASYADNGKNVLRAINLSKAVTLEGLTIRGAVGGVSMPPEPVGGGLFAQASRLRVSDCVFVDNASGQGGGAGIVDALDLVVERCRFGWNRAHYQGGGLYASATHIDTRLSVRDCLFENQNSGLNSLSTKSFGGLLLQEASGGRPSLVERCEFINNAVVHSVGGAGASIFVDCRFQGNSADRIGGVAARTLVNCEVVGNFSVDETGGASVFNAINCLFQGNVTGQDDGGGVRALGGDFVNCRFIGNSIYNLFAGVGGAAYVVAPSRFINCLFTGNDSLVNGGAIATAPGASVKLVNSTIANNWSGNAGAALLGDGDLRNCLVWNNRQAMSGGWSASYSCVEGGWPGTGNISADPQFVAPLGRDGIPGTADDDLRLQLHSPCIDAADNVSVPADDYDLDGDGDLTEATPHDVAGELRFAQHSQVPDSGMPNGTNPPSDIGCYELPVPGDIALNGLVDVNDLLALIGVWGPCVDPTGCPADIAPDGGDGVVNVNDLLLLLFNWS